MKKLISFLVFIVIVIYILVEFLGDSVIKGSLESNICLLYTSPSPRDAHESRMPSSA